MNRENFSQALAAVLRGENARDKGIGTLREKTLHAVLKRYMEPYEGSHEVRIGSYVADIVGENGIVEIQTRGFNQLRKKLTAFLEVATVTIVYPIAYTKWLIWVDPETGEATGKRKSPKRGTVYDAFYELYKIKPLLTHPNLRVHLILLDMEEYRHLNGWSHDRKRGSSRYERIPTALVDEMIVASPEEYRKLIPAGLPEQFTSEDYGKATGLAASYAQTALNVLRYVGAVTRVGRKGRLHLYQRSRDQLPEEVL